MTRAELNRQHTATSDIRGARIDLAELLAMIRLRWLLVLLLTLLFGAICAVFAKTAQKLYQAEATLLPREAAPATGIMSQIGQLGGLAGLVGVGTASKAKEESLAVLRSRTFIRSFISRMGISEQLAQASAPIFQVGAARTWVIDDAVGFFQTSVLTVFDDKKSGAVKITIQWHDPAIAAAWANALAAQLNEDTRANAIREADRNIKYLTAEITNSKVVSITPSIGNLLEGEIRRLMVARGTVDYAYRVVDPAVAPRQHVWPRLLSLTLLGAAFGFAVSILLCLMLSMMHRSQSGFSAGGQGTK